MAVRDADHRLDLLGGARQDRDLRQEDEVLGVIGGERPQLVRVGDDRVLADRAPQLFDDLGSDFAVVHSCS